jgi:hypothetical protein
MAAASMKLSLTFVLLLSGIYARLHVPSSSFFDLYFEGVECTF